jgi:hypothetical protein
MDKRVPDEDEDNAEARSPKAWRQALGRNKATLVPGRLKEQCRKRWRVMDPSIACRTEAGGLYGPKTKSASEDAVLKAW